LLLKNLFDHVLKLCSWIACYYLQYPEEHYYGYYIQYFTCPRVVLN